MKRTWYLVLGAVLVLVVLASPTGPTAAFQAGTFCADTEENAFLTLINQYRAENGLKPLALSQTLSEAADAHSRDMAGNNFMSHDGSNGSQPENRMRDNGYTAFSWSAENIFAGDKSAAEAFAWWKSSPGHNANMLDPKLSAIGIGRAGNPDSDLGWYWTTTFGDKVDAAACVEGGQGIDPPADENPARDVEVGDIAPAGNAGAAAGPGNQTNGNGEKAVSCIDTEEQAFLTLINDYRAENGLNPLSLSPSLSAAADAHSLDMAANDFVGHDGSNGSSPEQRFVANGYTDLTRWAENVFAGDKDAAGAIAWWKSSPGHNANMLDPKLAAIGIGRAPNSDSDLGWFWTTTFGDKVDGGAETVAAKACVDPAPNGQRPAAGSNNDTNDADEGGNSPSPTATAVNDDTDSDIPDGFDDGPDDGTDDDLDSELDGGADDGMDCEMDCGTDDGMDGDMDDGMDDGSDGMDDGMGDDTGAGPLDSDGDGVPDDIEINSGTDPNDPNSF
jgi:uncharacterized protein YkwD